MTPQFTERIDPILADVFQLLRRIESGEDVTPDQQRQRFVQALDEVRRAELDKASEWHLAIYAVTCWIDEMLIGAPWRQGEWWRKNSLEAHLFKTRDANRRFYLDNAKATSEDAIESFYVCALLGFRGLYGSDSPVNQRLKEEHNLPADQSNWLASRRERVMKNLNDSRILGSGARDREPRRIKVATRRWSWTAVLLPWVLVAILAGAIVFSAQLSGAL